MSLSDSPSKMPLAAWEDVLSRSWSEASEDNIGLIAAGVAFYGFLALVPLLGAVVLSYGLVADPQSVIHNVQGLTSVMPGDAAKLVGEQLLNVVKTSSGKKGVGLLLALGLAIFGARSAAASIITALNVAYEEKEKRSFIVVNLLALGITAAGVVVAVLAVVAVAALGHLEKLFPAAPTLLVGIGKLLSYAAVALAGAAGAATLYWYGPSRERPRWVWLTPGSIFAALVWLALTLGFGIYVARFGKYNATYGSLGAVVVMLTWLYFSGYALLFGAEINSELEKYAEQSAKKQLGDLKTSTADQVAADKRKPASELVTPLGDAGKPSTEASVTDGYKAARKYAKLSPLIGLDQVGRASSGLATIGLAVIRKPGRIPQGIALLASAAVLSYAARPRKP